MVKVMSIQNEKGGGGKTQSATNIAFGLSNAGLRVLLVDLDPQANATSIILKPVSYTHLTLPTIA